MENSYLKLTKRNIFNVVWFFFITTTILSLNIFLSIDDDVSPTWVLVITCFASVFGVIGTFLAILKTNWNWLFGTTHVILYGIIAFQATVYGDFILNIFIFLPLSFVGFYNWRKYLNRESEKKHISSNKLSFKNLIILSFTIIIFIAFFGFSLSFTNDVSPYLDSASTILSILGMILMAYFFVEQWVVWFIVDIISILIWVFAFIEYGNSIYIVFIFMWFIYLCNASIGMFYWYNDLNKVKK